MKKRWLAVGLSCGIVLAAVTGISVFQPKEIKADRVYGYGKNLNEYNLSIVRQAKIKSPVRWNNTIG